MTAQWPVEREIRAAAAALAFMVGLTLAALIVTLAGPSDPLENATLTTTIVESGDTWWDLADTCGDELDKRLVIQLLQERSKVGTELHPGDEILTCAQAVAS